jgi:hypothetical protein
VGGLTTGIHGREESQKRAFGPFSVTAGKKEGVFSRTLAGV